MQLPSIPTSWQTPELQNSYQNLLPFLTEEYNTQTIYPPKEQIFASLNLVSPATAKVIIIGQDPYHNPGQAMGLAFSVPDGSTPLPPSLKNIFKEIEAETGARRNTPDLTDWAEQGVLLLNTTLTVRQNAPASHSKAGWAEFTAEAVKYLSSIQTPKSWLLWGSHAQSLEKYIMGEHNLILKSAHPSPLSVYRGFFGNNHFIKTNEFLLQHGLSPIRWA